MSSFMNKFDIFSLCNLHTALEIKEKNIMDATLLYECAMAIVNQGGKSIKNSLDKFVSCNDMDEADGPKVCNPFYIRFFGELDVACQVEPLKSMGIHCDKLFVAAMSSFMIFQ